MTRLLTGDILLGEIIHWRYIAWRDYSLAIYCLARLFTADILLGDILLAIFLPWTQLTYNYSTFPINIFLYCDCIRCSTYIRAVHSTAREPNLALWPKFFGSLGGVKNSIGFGSFGDHDLALLALWHVWSYIVAIKSLGPPSFLN